MADFEIHPLGTRLELAHLRRLLPKVFYGEGPGIRQPDEDLRLDGLQTAEEFLADRSPEIKLVPGSMYFIDQVMEAAELQRRPPFMDAEPMNKAELWQRRFEAFALHADLLAQRKIDEDVLAGLSDEAPEL